MDLTYGAEAEAFRKHVRTFLKENWAPKGVERGAMGAYVSAFRQKATEAGYLYRGIPKEFGGSEQAPDVITAQVIREEFARAHAPMEVSGNGMNMLVPTLLERGTQAQKDRFIRPSIRPGYGPRRGQTRCRARNSLVPRHTRRPWSAG